MVNPLLLLLWLPLVWLLARVLLVVKAILFPPKEIRAIPSPPLLPMLTTWFFGRLELHERFEKFFLPFFLDPEFKKFGCIRIFIGRWFVYIMDPELAKEYLKDPNYQKADLAKEFGPNSHPARFWGVNLVFSNGEEWRRPRVIANPAFENEYLRTLSSHFAECGVALSDLLRGFAEKKEAFDVYGHTQRLTLDALGKAGFGFDFNSIRDPTSKYVVIASEITSRIASPIRFFFPFIDYLPTKKNKELKEKMGQFDGLLFSLIDAHRKKLELGVAQEGEKKHVLHRMLSSKDEGGLTDKELRDNMTAIFFAGHDTTSTSLTACLYFMAKCPETQERARKEVLQAMGDAEIPTYEHQRDLPYLTAIIKESLRIVPPFHQIPRRFPSETTQLGPFTIPAGTPVSVSIYSLHHDPGAWGEDVEEFKPERFLDQGVVEKEKRRHPFQWIPFGGGPRICIGNNFSLIEQRIVLMILLKKFQFKLVHPDDKIKLKSFGLPSPKISLRVETL